MHLAIQDSQNPIAEQAHTERRRFYRTTVLDAFASVDGYSNFFEILDVSPGGAALCGRHFLMPGDKVQLTLFVNTALESFITGRIVQGKYADSHCRVSVAFDVGEMSLPLLEDVECAFCGNRDFIRLEYATPFCEWCIRSARQTELDVLYDDLGEAG